MSELIYFVKNKFVRNVLVLVVVFTIFGESRLRCKLSGLRRWRWLTACCWFRETTGSFIARLPCLPLIDLLEDINIYSWITILTDRFRTYDDLDSLRLIISPLSWSRQRCRESSRPGTSFLVLSVRLDGLGPLGSSACFSSVRSPLPWNRRDLAIQLVIRDWADPAVSLAGQLYCI